MPSSRRNLIAAPIIARMARAATKFDPEYATAKQAVDALAAGTVSSQELIRHLFARIRMLNAKMNAFVTLREEEALAEAKKPDGSKTRRPLEGLPVTVKDAFATAGPVSGTNAYSDRGDRWN